MNLNPFTTNTFTKIWLKHFSNDSTNILRGPFKDLQFYKTGKIPVYTNVGANHTKGISYTFDKNNSESWKNKVFLIHDVPDYFNVDTTTSEPNLGNYKVTQYPGFLIDLSPYKDLADFMGKKFSKSSRYKLNKYKKRLEASFDIRYRMYRGEISKEEFDSIFDHFRNLLEKRFDDKEITNNNLDPKEWSFYYDVTYPMILEGTAGLYVIYQGDQPIGVTLNFFSENIMFDAITVFDIDFFKFHLGSVTIMKLIEWCLENGFKTFDFSKGYFDYKTRWSSLEYQFEYHIYYDKSSLKARCIASGLKLWYEQKQNLRKKGINERFHKFTYSLKNRKRKTEKPTSYQFSDIDSAPSQDTLIRLPLKDEKNQWLRPIIFDFLYLSTDTYNSIEVYQIKDQKNIFFISGNESNKLLTLN